MPMQLWQLVSLDDLVYTSFFHPLYSAFSAYSCKSSKKFIAILNKLLIFRRCDLRAEGIELLEWDLALIFPSWYRSFLKN